MPEENIFKANPIEIMRLSQSLVKDYIDLRDKTDELIKEYKKLGLSYIDDGYRQLGEVLGLIEKDISERNGHMGLVAHQLDIAAQQIMEALKAEAAARAAVQNVNEQNKGDA